MKRLLLVVAVVLAVALLTAVPAFAEPQSTHPHCESGRTFGEHVSSHAKDGLLGKEHNPGNHQGFSECVP